MRRECERRAAPGSGGAVDCDTADWQDEHRPHNGDLASDWVAVRPPGFWPWAVDQLLDARNAVRRRTRRVARPLTELAHRQVERHGVTCAGCGLGNAFEPHPYMDVGLCSGCGREVSGLRWVCLPSRPIRTWLFGA